MVVPSRPRNNADAVCRKTGGQGAGGGRIASLPVVCVDDTPRARRPALHPPSPLCNHRVNIEHALGCSAHPESRA